MLRRPQHHCKMTMLPDTHTSTPRAQPLHALASAQTEGATTKERLHAGPDNRPLRTRRRGSSQTHSKASVTALRGRQVRPTHSASPGTGCAGRPRL